MSIWEAVMLLSFGAAWPFSIYRSAKTRSNEGKSLAFLVILEVGYFAGIMHKILYSLDYVLALYICNSIMVFIDMLLYFRNKRLAGKGISHESPKFRKHEMGREVNSK